MSQRFIKYSNLKFHAGTSVEFFSISNER
ncbi:hypothetical protein ACFSTA_09180 [Ornithinibacillus salinisoli]|uniref:Uncharacterized protein n=1 Tax=Ornithinibacillus salinisoli TaxID=1848459 RepID=A0ABW4VXS9_9BACI